MGAVGDVDGGRVGSAVGAADGVAVGAATGAAVGAVGTAVGAAVGATVPQATLLSRVTYPKFTLQRHAYCDDPDPSTGAPVVRSLEQ